MDIVFIIAASLALALYGLVVYSGKKRHRILKKHPTFSAKHKDQYPIVSFEYEDIENERLRELKEKYNLDAIAGLGSDSERIINLMKWVNQLTSHTGNPEIPQELNALHLIDLCVSENKKLNCMMYAFILNEVCLALGYPSRVIHLLPYSNEQRESHWVNAVYAAELEKWVMMDPDMCGYLRDEDGRLLGISEIRERMVTGMPLIVNDDIRGLSKILGKWSYLWYLSKNIFRYNCQRSSLFDQQSQRDNLVFYELLPDGFREELLTEPKVTSRGNQTVYINDERLFWQRPLLLNAQPRL